MPKKREKSGNSEISDNLQQGNEISRAIYKMSAEQQTLVYFALFKIEKQFNPVKFLENYDPETKESINYNDFVAKFDIYEMCQVMGINFHRELKARYLNELNEITKLVFKLREGKITKWFPFFSYAEYDKEDGLVKIVFNPFFFREVFGKRYSLGNMKILGQIRKNHMAQRLYFYLLSFKNMQGEKYHQQEGQWQIKLLVSELKTMLCIEDKFPRNDSLKRAINIAVDVINTANFEFDTETEFFGKPFNEIVFTCTNKLKLKKLPQEKNSRYETIAANNQQKLIALYKKKHEDEWEAKKTEIKKSEPSFNFGLGIQEQVAEFSTFKYFFELDNGYQYEA